MPRCVAIGCNENGNHSFPKDLRLKKLRERATKIKIFKSKPHSMLCFRHFKESDFECISSTTGATLGGLFSFCTEGYAGSTSDRQMRERFTLLKACEKGDVSMADREFNVQDLFADKDVSMLTPTFMRGLTQLPGIKL